MKKKPTRKKSSTDDQSFEDALESLRGIVSDLEAGELGLEESMHCQHTSAVIDCPQTRQHTFRSCIQECLDQANRFVARTSHHQAQRR